MPSLNKQAALVAARLYRQNDREAGDMLVECRREILWLTVCLRSISRASTADTKEDLMRVARGAIARP